eukprot:scaffold266675_cov31-Tisochrysis_lutea.AAC.2
MARSSVRVRGRWCAAKSTTSARSATPEQPAGEPGERGERGEASNTSKASISRRPPPRSPRSFYG